MSNLHTEQVIDQGRWITTKKIKYLNKILKEEISFQELSEQAVLPVRTIKSWMNTFFPGLEDYITELKRASKSSRFESELELDLELLQQENIILKNKCLGLIMDKELMKIGR